MTGLYVGFATIGSFLWWYRDKHVSLHQLSDWTRCETWLDFTHSADAPILPLNPCEIFYEDGAGKHKARAQTMALSTLVVMEMLKALSAVSLTQSMIKIPPWTSPILIAGVTVPFLLHLMVRSPLSLS